MSQNRALQDQLAIQSLILKSASLLDAEDLTGWQSLFDARGEYQITAWSTELRKTLSWWKTDMPALSRILAEVRDHVRDPARRLHVVSAGLADVSGDSAMADSAFAVYRSLPTGESSLYVVGHYKDQLARDDSGQWLLMKRVVQLDTRVLQAFTHLPL